MYVHYWMNYKWKPEIFIVDFAPRGTGMHIVSECCWIVPGTISPLED
jgi:hypothetical protein